MNSRRDLSFRIAACIRGNLCNPQLGVEFLVRHLCISYSYLHEVTCLTFAMSPRQLIESMRLHRVLDELLTQQGTLLEICHRAGYANAKTFRCAFKKRLGVRPTECRRRLRASANPGSELKRLKRILWQRPRTSYAGNGKSHRMRPEELGLERPSDPA